MYSEKEVAESGSALKKFIALYGVIAAVLLAVLVIDQFQFMRMGWPSYVSAGLLAIVSLFLWGNYGVRLVAWRRFLTEMKKGLERSVSGTIASIDKEENVKEGLEFRALRLFTGEDSDKAGGRLLYVDVSRFPLPVDVGQKVDCMLFGNYIKDIKTSEE